MSLERKQEASVPVQGRVDLRTLATFALYWESQGYLIDSMSKLISWTIDAFKEVLVSNKPEINDVSTLEEACEILATKGLMNRTLMNKAERKINQARGLENIRLDGWDIDKNSNIYKELHPKNQVSPFPGMVKNDKPIRSEVEEYYAEREREKEEEQRVNIERQKANAMKSGRVVHLEGESETVKSNIDRNLEKMKKADEALERF
jgi:hypothetical protein